MSREVMLSTVDNEVNPFDDFKLWLKTDILLGHNSLEYLGRIAKTSDAMTEEERMQEKERAIDEILKYDFLNIYKKVVRESN